MSREFSFAAVLLAILFLLTACPNDKSNPRDYYCASGYHLAAGGACLPDEPESDGDGAEADRPDMDPADGDLSEKDGEVEAEIAPESEANEADEAPEVLPDGDAEQESEPDAEPDGEAGDAEADAEASEQDGGDADEAPIAYCLTVKAPSTLGVGTSSKLGTSLAVCGSTAAVANYTITLESYDPAKLAAEADDAAAHSFTLRGLAAGDTTIGVRALIGTTRVASKDAALSVAARNKVEARGLWVNRWAFSGDKTQGPKDIAAIMTKAKNAHFNQVYFQVRGTFDAYYDSRYEPWAARLSGTLGVDPGWDPLAVAIAEAHNRGLELHAWINVFTMWSSTTAPTDPEHALVKYPGWVMCDASGTPMTALVDSYIWASPGNSYVRQHNTAVVVDIATRYDVDGVHLDRVRYPSVSYSHDEASVAAYNAALTARPGLSFADWEREQIVAQVAEMYAALTEKAPKVALTAAVIGIYKDVWGWGSVSEGYYDSLQDSRAFDDQGVIDALMPMVYWPCTGTGARTDFCAIAPDWGATKNRALMIIGADLDAAKSALPVDRPLRRKAAKAGYESFSQIASQIANTRASNGVDGWALYDYGTLESANYWSQLAAGPFAEEAVVPFMWWK